MEINNENKAKFFAQYWDQYMGFSETGNTKTYVDERYIKSYAFPIYYLLLKPLSSITDEDAVKCAEILGHKVFIGNKFIQNIERGSWLNNSLQDINHLIDYLRSKGYALPYMGLSVEQMVEAGWVKLTEALNSKEG